ncbi:hypothetical protein [Thalassotalea sp. PS06]|uniref:hypothetical protein n=1 Tax=Thalassotalea sp. PS06 TaxID=2594005 RepID=UPI0011620CDC|nr:hypothetical protein [Thalassotalea sp. PS06]QDP01940.1 hypothetical protein FNC98_11670 [Thalassotalea sp. PS06]
MLTNLFSRERDKRVFPQLFIHVGPGKTGTSVIQNWCSKNTKFLEKKGYYYPEHNLDENGISSGHAGLLGTVIDGKWTLSSSKINKFKGDISRLRNKKIILSSEAFWRHLDKLIEYFPGAQFIFYIRSPLEFFESGYNQNVKRSRLMKPIADRYHSFSARPYGAEFLTKAVRDYRLENFIIRLYSRDLFAGGNILHDFFEIFNISKLPNLTVGDVNPSYCFEALEFKRLINHYHLSAANDIKLDKLLQSYQGGVTDYSIVDPETYEAFKIQVVDTLVPLLEQCKIPESSAKGFLDQIKTKKQKAYFKQNLSDDARNSILQYLSEHDNDLAALLRMKLKCKPGDEADSSVTEKVQLGKGVPKTAHRLLDSLTEIYGNDIASAELYRDLSCCFEHENLGLAQILMENAAKLRPTGPFINSKLSYLNKLLDESGS